MHFICVKTKVKNKNAEKCHFTWMYEKTKDVTRVFQLYVGKKILGGMICILLLESDMRYMRLVHFVFKGKIFERCPSVKMYQMSCMPYVKYCICNQFLEFLSFSKCAWAGARFPRAGSRERCEMFTNGYVGKNRCFLTTRSSPYL